MSKSIDSIGPRPDKKQVKPVAEHKAGEVVRPKGAPTQAGEAIKPRNYTPPKKVESSVGKPEQPKKPVNKKKVAIFAGLVGLFVVTTLSLIWLLQGTRLLESIGKPKPSAGNFAEVGDQTASLDEFEKVKASYLGFNNKQSSPEDSNTIAATASRDLLTYLALSAEAKKQGLTCTQDIVDTRMSEQYASRGGKDGFYSYLKQEYGWDPSVTYMKVCSDYYREVLAETSTSGTDVFGVYIRWDQLASDATAQELDSYERDAKSRLERDFLPLFERGASKEEIYRAADISPYSTYEEFDKKMETPGSPWVRTVEYPRLNEALYSTFQQYPEGERDIDYVSKLAVGENTKVFKSKVGYYAIFRATNRVQGNYESIDQLVQQYLESAKYSNAYYALPELENTQNLNDINNIPADAATSLLDTARQALVPTARAAGVNCFTNHKLPMNILYTDYDTGLPIPLKQMRDDKGAPVANLQIISTGNVQAACNDEPAPIVGAFGVLNFGYWNGRASWDVYDHQNNPWIFDLSCYTSWEFRFGTVVGYNPVNYQDATQFRVTLLTNTGQWVIQDRASAYSDHYRIPPDLYFGIANGALGYSINVKMKKTYSPPPIPQYMTVSGEKQEEDGTKTGPYANNTVREQPGGKTSSGQPYSLTDLRADQGHSFTVDAEPGYDVFGYRVNNGPIVRSTTYNYVAGTVGAGQTIDVDWIFRKRPTVNLSVTCDIISGSVDGGGAANIEVYARVAGEDLVDGSGQVIRQGRNFSFIVPEKYKDGVARTVQIRLVVDGADVGVGTNGTGTLVCQRNAQCISNNLATIFPNGSTTLNVGQSESGIKIGMRNNGQAIWGAYPSGTYRLGLNGASETYWNITGGAVTSRIYPAPAPGGQLDTIEFSPTLELKSQPNTAATPLVFTMEFVPSDGSPVIEFGGTCGTNLRVLSSYGPWLRAQNGNVSALGMIEGQETVTASGDNLGGRREAGSAAGPYKDDLNKEVTYLAIAHAVTNGPFCSTNAYLLGRDADDGTSNISSCDFSSYVFRLRDTLAQGLKKGDSTEVIYREAAASYNTASCDPAVGPTPSGSGRYSRGVNNYNGNNAPTANGVCPTITVLNKAIAADPFYTLGKPKNAAGAPANFVPTGRTTILVDDDLYVNADIKNPAAGVSFNVDDLNGLNALPNLGIIVRGNIIIDRDVTQIDASLYASGQIITCDLYNPDALNPSETTTGFKAEQSGGPTGPNNTASACNKALRINGLAAAKGGFKFGRNFVDFSVIASRISVPNQYNPNFDYGADKSLYYGRPAEDVIFNGLMLLAPPPGFEYLSSPDFSSARYTSDNAQPRF